MQTFRTLQMSAAKLTTTEGTLAYTLSGPSTGRLVVLAHGIADSSRAYRFLAPKLADAGYRVANLDNRGCGESSVGWAGYSRTDIANDLIALVKHINPGQPAIIVGHSNSGGAATIAAALEPTLFAGLIEICPFTKEQSMGIYDLWRKGPLRLVGALLASSPVLWGTYLEAALPGTKRPSDWAEEKALIQTRLQESGRMTAFKQMCFSPPVDAGAKLEAVKCPVLIIMGSADCDWASPRAEGDAILAKLPPGLGQLEMLDHAGHYPHYQYPDETWALMQPFLGKHLR